MSLEIIKTNICIIGAGPSGATTSLFLSKLNIPHTIVDSQIFPRDKVCGDALDLKVMRVLNQLDPTLVDREVIPNDNFIKSKGCRIIFSEKKNKDIIVRDKSLSYPFFFVAKRGYFDNFLAQKINSVYADFRQGTKVKNIVREGGLWHIYVTDGIKDYVIESNLLVGADGDQSVVLRSLGKRKIIREHYAGALRQYWKGISGIDSNQLLEIYLPKSLPLAYLWIFPLPNGEANVGCGLSSEMIAKKSIDLKKVFHNLITQDPALADRFKNATPLEKPVGWGLPLASQHRKASGDGYLLVGDAAALVCPTTGEGIGPGMMSGYIAAHFIKRAVDTNKFDDSMFKNYDREISKRLKSDIKKYNFIRKLSPYLYNQLINILSKLSISEMYINKKMGDWIKTAKEKPIVIEY